MRGRFQADRFDVRRLSSAPALNRKLREYDEEPLTPTTSRTRGPLRLAVPPLPQERDNFVKLALMGQRPGFNGPRHFNPEP